jgi:glycosyltransferase involved in cell wall biosynthesis
LLAEEKVRREMGERGREFAMGRFSAEKMVEGLEKVYEDALRHGRDARGT